jgi:hypothetical protein
VSEVGITSVPVPGGTLDALPGEVVRNLFDRNEQVLEALRSEFDEVVREADAAEAKLRAHPALGLLAADEAAMLVPVPSDRREPGATTPTELARTTVDPRPRPTAPPGPAVPDVPGGSDPRDGNGTGKTRVSRLIASHWVWKCGVAVTVVALLLLKFG